MAVFDSNPSALEEKLEMMKLKNQLLDEKVSSTQKKAMIKELKRKYGKDWKSILKLGKDSDLMKQFASAGRKMGDIGSGGTDINASKYNFQRSSRPSQPQSRDPYTPPPSQPSRPKTSTPESLIEASRKSLGR